MSSPDSHLSAFDLERLVDGQLSDHEYRRVVAQIEREPDGWRRCCLAFLEHQALRSDLHLLSDLGFDAEPGSEDERAQNELERTPAGHFLVGGTDIWDVNHSGEGSRLGHWIKNPLWGFSVMVAASVLVFVGVGALRDRLNPPVGLSEHDSSVDAGSLTASLAGNGRTTSPIVNGQLPIHSDFGNDLAADPVRHAVFRVENDSAGGASAVEVPLVQAEKSRAQRINNRSAAVAGSPMNSSLNGFSKPYKVDRRVFLVMTPEGKLALVPVEVIRIEAFQ